MSKLNSIPVALLFVIGGSIVCAQTRDHDITLDDYFSQSNISTMVYSPDGRNIAYTEGRWQEDIDRRNTDLWVVSTSKKEVRRLTFDPAGESSPQWSADSRHIYFMTSRNAATMTILRTMVRDRSGGSASRAEKSTPSPGSKRAYRVFNYRPTVALFITSQARSTSIPMRGKNCERNSAISITDMAW